MKTIALCMIVKDEAAVMVRCLESVRPLVDYVLIEDTGSTDGTQDLVRAYLAEQGLAGEIYDKPWKDFATNRTSVLAALQLRAEIDYALIMDADDVLALPPAFDAALWKEQMCADVYSMAIGLGPISYQRPQMCSNRLPFRFRGVLHEFLDCPGAYTSAEAPGLSIVCDRDGARSRDPQKYQRDAETLERALLTETDPLMRSRYTFYLAQSYRDAGEAAKALPLYLARAEQGFWAEERFVSLYTAAKLKALLGYPSAEVIGLFLEAYETCPTRVEALHGAMLYCRHHGKYQQGYLIGRQAVTIARPANGLFLESWIYDYGVFDEYAVLAYWAGQFADCARYAERILQEGLIPEAERVRVGANAVFARQKM